MCNFLVVCFTPLHLSSSVFLSGKSRRFQSNGRRNSCGKSYSPFAVAPRRVFHQPLLVQEAWGALHCFISYSVIRFLSFQNCSIHPWLFLSISFDTGITPLSPINTFSLRVPPQQQRERPGIALHCNCLTT
jgi:hypothetical protein